jgi:hypothetical protein
VVLTRSVIHSCRAERLVRSVASLSQSCVLATQELDTQRMTMDGISPHLTLTVKVHSGNHRNTPLRQTQADVVEWQTQGT